VSRLFHAHTQASSIGPQVQQIRFLLSPKVALQIIDDDDEDDDNDDDMVLVVRTILRRRPSRGAEMTVSMLC